MQKGADKVMPAAYDLSDLLLVEQRANSGVDHVPLHVQLSRSLRLVKAMQQASGKLDTETMYQRTYRVLPQRWPLCLFLITSFPPMRPLHRYGALIPSPRFEDVLKKLRELRLIRFYSSENSLTMDVSSLAITQFPVVGPRKKIVWSMESVASPHLSRKAALRTQSLPEMQIVFRTP